MMYYAVFEAASEYYPIGLAFANKREFLEACGDSETLSVSNILRFCITGGDYEERKENLRDLAIEWSNADRATVDLHTEIAILHWFERHGKRYGLLDEFRENAII